jgi:hypothetical protein
MIGLSDNQFKYLEQQLASSGINRQGLLHDLLDHYCCLTEHYMQQGVDFEAAACMALNELAPDGLKAIETDLEFLLTFKFQLSMKRMLFLGGFLASFGQTAYVLFRFMHWPGSNAMLFMACAALFFMVIPALLVELKQSYANFSTQNKIRFLAGLIGITLFGLGSAFKMLHWPVANIQIVLGTVILALIFFPLYFWQQYQKSVNQLYA